MAGRYIMLLSVHGLIRGHDLELGRDADTGGQTKYVVELARAIANHREVDRVDLVTRRIIDDKVAQDYAVAEEEIAPGARIIRIRCGPDRYVFKEALWPFLDEMTDNIVDYLRKLRRTPDIVHGHYADAGYVASRLSGILDLPMAFTGHSLGRVKKQRLLEGGSSEEQLEKRYKITRRIDAEERSLVWASIIVASTEQERHDQYGLYDRFSPEKTSVIPPGVDLSRFSPPPRTSVPSPIEQRIQRFLAVPEKPVILALSRPDPRKNIPRLVEAFAHSEPLRHAANLVLVAGQREKLSALDAASRKTWWTLLQLIDDHDLHGSVAYPKTHASEEVPDLYRFAAKRHGVFINPALTEPFGLTLLEAAASGVPVVATNDGGPRDILGACQNGLLIDPLDIEGIANALLEVLRDRKQWQQWSKSGLRGVARHYSWKAHVDRFMKVLSGLKTQPRSKRAVSKRTPAQAHNRVITADRLLITDIDNTLVGKKEALRDLMRQVRKAGDRVAFGVATGRNLKLTLEVLDEHQIKPDLYITSVGTGIYWGGAFDEDRGWSKHIDHRWRPQQLEESLKGFEGLEPQPPDGQDRFKLSYRTTDPDFDPNSLRTHLRRAKLAATVIHSHGTYLDLIPIRASKGLAVRYLARRLEIPLDLVLVAGDSGNDAEMLTGNTLGVVVGNHDPELDPLRGLDRVYFAKQTHARGILEGMAHYDFFERTEESDR